MRKVKQAWDYIFKSPVNDIEKVESPYIIRYVNNSDIEKDCVLFGHNKYIRHENFGSDIDVKIINVQSSEECDYLSILSESAINPFIIAFWRLETDTLSNIEQVIYVNRIKGNGVKVGIPINLAYMKDMFQFHELAIDLKRRTLINGSTSISFKIAPKSFILFGLYPLEENRFKVAEIQIEYSRWTKFKTFLKKLFTSGK